MVIKSLIISTRCDNGVCGNMADYTIEKEGTPRNMQLNLCENCIKELYSHFSTIVCPKKKNTKKENYSNVGTNMECSRK